MSIRNLLSFSIIFAASISSAAAQCSGVNCLVISQVYGGGGNSGATLTNDYIEIFNRGSAAVSLNGLSVQYAAATSNFTQTTALTNVSLLPGQFYLIQEAVGNGGTTPLPAPNVSGSIMMSASAAKVALVNGTTAITGTCPTTAPVIDIVGYGTTSCSPGAPVLTNTTADLRNNLCIGGTLPSSAFTAGTPAPRNTSTALAPCGAPAGISFTPTSLSPATVNVSYSQAFTPAGGNGTYTFSISGGAFPPGLSLTTAGLLSGMPTTVTGSPFSFQITVSDGTTSAAQNYSLAVNAAFTCSVSNTIAQIQGSGLTAAVLGPVTTTGIVTARRSNGFHLQMASGDGDPLTSDAIFVFTNSAPAATASLGNSVCVSGTVTEFTPDAGYSTITEITGPVVNQLSTGNPLPAPVALSPADFNAAGSIYQREKYESMRVSVSSITVIAPTQGNVDEANAAGTSNGIFFGVLPGVPRPLREPGIDINLPLPAGAPATVPRWDANPEILRVNTVLQTGGTAIEVTSGATVSNLVGVVDYKFGQYTLLTDPSAVPPLSVAGNVTFTAVPAALPTDLTIGSFNLQRFFDTTNDPAVSDPVLTAAALNRRLGKASLAIRNVAGAPDVLAIQEMENLSTLQQLAARIDADAAAANQTPPNYQSYLTPGNDIGGINNAFLVKPAKVTVLSVTQYGKDATYLDPTANAQAIINDRPPLVLKATAAATGSSQSYAVTVIANHLRSLIDVDDPVDGPRVRAKREAGAEYLANLVQSFQAAGDKVFVVGDLNAYEVNDGYADILGVIRGNPAPASQVTLAGPTLVSPILTDAVDLLPTAQRYSDTFDGTAQVLDHLLFTQNAASSIRTVAYGRLNADFPESYRSDGTRPERVSDHDPVIAFISLPVSAGAVNVTSQTSTSGSGLSYNRATQIYSGTLTVMNTGSQTITGPVQILFRDLAAGVTLVNASGTSAGSPYLTASPASLAPGQSVTGNVQFRNTGTARIGYTTQIFSGTF